MSLHRRFSPLAVLAFAALLPFLGCKSQNSQTANQNPQQPSAAQPSSQSAAQTASSPSGTASQPASQAATPAPPPPAVVDLPAGTRIRVSLDEELGSKISQTGDSFRATVADAVLVNGHTVIPSGSRAQGVVVDAKPLGRFKGEARLQLRLDRVQTKWGIYPVSTTSIDRVESGKGRRSAEFIGGGGGGGALIGALAGGGKGALIGGLLGAGAGTAGSAFTGNKQIDLPSGTLLTFHLEHSVHITQQ
ncbi:MAG: hypothetical protein ACP5FH_01355 [Terracidiphilus sp.]